MTVRAGLLLPISAGAAWGVGFWSWSLPAPLLVRVAVTVLLVAVLSAASREGRIAAAAFALGMGISSGVLLSTEGQLISAWALVPATALVTAGLLAATLKANAGQGAGEPEPRPSIETDAPAK